MNAIDLQKVQAAVLAARARCRDQTICVHYKAGEYQVLREVYNAKQGSLAERAAVLEHVQLSQWLPAASAIAILEQLQ